MSNDDDQKPTNLATADKALLECARTGAGAVEVTPALLDKMRANLDARIADIDERFPKLIEACPYETKLAVAAWVMRHIVEHATGGGSFRYLIYDRLGFGPDAYVPLYNAGGMTISNEFTVADDARNSEPHSRD